MLYILVEDTKSGYDFWVSVNKLLFNDKARIITCGGIYNAQKVLMGLGKQNRLNKGDTLAIILDNIANDIVGDTYDMAKRMENKIGFKLILSKLYCIEEIFVSSEKLYEWCKLKIYREELKVIRKSILDNEDYYINPEKSISDYIRNKTSGGKKKLMNREQMIASILSEATKGTPFSFNNKSYSPCWYTNCCYLERLFEDIKCTLSGEQHRLPGIIKLNELIDTSILPFRVDLQGIYEVISNCKENYIMIYHKDILMDKGKTLADITNIRDDMNRDKVDITKYGIDIFEQVYNYIEEEGEGEMEYTESGIKSF